MHTKQTIAIIGASGNMGPAISKNLFKGNYRILLCAKEQDKIQSLAEEIEQSNAAAEVGKCFTINGF